MCGFLTQNFIHISQLTHTMRQNYKQIFSHCYEFSSCTGVLISP